MADTGIFCTTTEVVRKAGSGASATATAEAYTNDYVTQVESFINTATRKNWSDTYTGLNADVKGVLKECASNLAAVYCVTYDMTGYTSRTEAEILINTLISRANDCITVLKDKKTETFIDGA